MERKMYAVAISVETNGDIRLTQANPYETDNFIILHPSQITLICRWLLEAENEAELGGK